MKVMERTRKQQRQQSKPTQTQSIDFLLVQEKEQMGFRYSPGISTLHKGGTHHSLFDRYDTEKTPSKGNLLNRF